MVIGAIEAGYGDDRAEYGRVCLQLLSHLCFIDRLVKLSANLNLNMSLRHKPEIKALGMFPGQWAVFLTLNYILNL